MSSALIIRKLLAPVIFGSMGFVFAQLPLAAAPKQSVPNDLKPLIRLLQDAGYRFVFQNPPVSGAYGATNARQKTVWLAPISVDLGISRQTLIHEMVHAAQACPTGRYEPIGWKVTLPFAVDREIEGILFRKYPHKQFPVEREAFFMQGHPNAAALLSHALKTRCR